MSRFFSFAPLTLIPMQKKLLDYALLTPKELDWLDEYHNTVRALPISFCYALSDLFIVPPRMCAHASEGASSYSGSHVFVIRFG